MISKLHFYNQNFPKNGKLTQVTKHWITRFFCAWHLTILNSMWHESGRRKNKICFRICQYYEERWVSCLLYIIQVLHIYKKMWLWPSFLGGYIYFFPLKIYHQPTVFWKHRFPNLDPPTTALDLQLSVAKIVVSNLE